VNEDGLFFWDSDATYSVIMRPSLIFACARRIGVTHWGIMVGLRTDQVGLADAKSLDACVGLVWDKLGERAGQSRRCGPPELAVIVVPRIYPRLDGKQ